MEKITFLIPVYNEEKTISVIVERIKAQKNLLTEIIIIDDHSNDNTLNELSKISQIYPDIKIVRHEKNMGKGSALKSGIKLATGNIILIQDADLEYNPNDYKNVSNISLFNNDLISGVYEMGSTFKTLTLAMALDLGLVKKSDSFNVTQPIKLGKYKTSGR
jgi:glycosyltransferase involved in cell wall biosynthesis